MDEKQGMDFISTMNMRFKEIVHLSILKNKR